jgi:hypothetical protein
LLWLSGLNLPVAYLLVLASLLFVRRPEAWSAGCPWFLIGISQAVAVILNWIDSDLSLPSLGQHLLASYVIGWLLAGALVTIGASGLISVRVLARAVSWLSVATISCASVAYLIALAVPDEALFLTSPVGLLLPASSPARIYSFGLLLYNKEDFMGMTLPRVSPLWPWPTALGTAAVCMFFILSTCPPGPFRRFARIGSVLMLPACLGRLSAASLLVGIAITWFIRASSPVRLWLIVATGSALILMILIVGGVTDLYKTLVNPFNAARQGSSEVREQIYAASWKGFYESPYFGKGWPGVPIFHDSSKGRSPYGTERGELIYVGTHSTISGLLYKGGGITFTCLCVAILSTLLTLLRGARNPHATSAIAILATIVMTCVGEGVESLVFPLLFAFLWMGVAIHSVQTSDDNPPLGGAA